MINDFPGRNENENIVMVIRKHPIVYIRLVMIFFALSILPVSIFTVVWFGYFPLSYPGATGILGYLGACFYLLYSLIIFLITWVNEEFDLFILTDQRLIDITQVNFFKRTEVTAPLKNIEDASTDIHGIFPSLLNYGTVEVKTAAGKSSDFFMDHVPNPVLVAKQILNCVHENQRRHISHSEKKPEEANIE